jgi:hypothetical protein
MYLGDIELARQFEEMIRLPHLGIPSKIEILTRKRFIAKKKAIEEF